jgi:uroporphyrinogen-III synthase
VRQEVCAVDGAGPLSGCTVVVTAQPGATDLVDTLTWRGATVLHAPTMQLQPVLDEEALVDTTKRVLANPPDDVLVTTASGFRSWLRAAGAAGLAGDLLTTLDEARLAARGPKARAAVRACGLVPVRTAPAGHATAPGISPVPGTSSDTTAGLVRWLVAQGVAGRKVVVQLPARPDHGPLEVLRAAGASVRGIEVNRCGPAPDPAAVDRAIGQICAGVADAVVHTSAAGAQALLDAAALSDRLPRLLVALRGPRLLNACVGPAAAAPLRAVGLDPLLPERPRLGALVRAVVERLAHDRAPSLDTAFGPLVLRGGGVTLDGVAVPLGPGPRAVLASLMAARGEVVSRPELLAALPGAEDAHTVEVTVNRLRRALGRPELVRTVVRRGYRLALPEPSA